MILPNTFYSEFGYQEVALPHLISGDAQIAGQISLMSTLRESRLNDETGRELEEMGIKHEYYVGSNGAHDLVAWKHLLYYRFLPNLWRNNYK